MGKTRDLILSEAVLDKLMLLFWEKGYFHTSLQDISLAAGISRTHLYKCFGGKQGLFHSMLMRFRSQVVVAATQCIQDPSAGMSGIEQFFKQFIECSREVAQSQGCFMIAVAANLPVHEPEAARVIEEFIHYLRSLFYKNLRWQQKEKLLQADLNTEMTADYLVGNVVGLMTLLRSAADAKMLCHHVQCVIQHLSLLPVRKISYQANLHLIT